MDTMPQEIINAFILIFIVTLTVFVLIPLFISYWRILQANRQETQRVAARPQEALGLLAGIIVGDIVIYTLGRYIFPIPAPLLYPIIGGIDLFFLFFVADNLIVELLTRRRLRWFERHDSQTQESQ
jgi:hypothetical protein